MILDARWSNSISSVPTKKSFKRGKKWFTSFMGYVDQKPIAKGKSFTMCMRGSDSVLLYTLVFELVHAQV